jgi:hypothetical protein
VKHVKKTGKNLCVSPVFFVSVILYLKYSRLFGISILTVLSKFPTIQNTKGEEMSEKEIALHFDLDNERENRTYFALKKLPNFLNEPDLSKAIILFVDNAINAIAECDERTARCEETIKAILGRQTHGRTEWQ